MIAILNPGWLSMVVDGGRYGYGDIGVPPSSALDHYAYATLNYLLGNSKGTPAVEVMGNGFSITFDTDLRCAITGAKVNAQIDGKPVPVWTPFEVIRGAVLRVKAVVEGFRYYVGFSGAMVLERVIKSFSTNLDCRFGGYNGRSFVKGDRIDIKTNEAMNNRVIPAGLIPTMSPPHRLRIIEGAEKDFFTPESIKGFFEKKEHSHIVSSKSNKTGIRLEGEPIHFRKGVDKSIISDGILPGTVQIPGDGLPIITLYERTIGGYARLGTVAKVDHDRLAHLKPGDAVLFERITMEEAETLWNRKMEQESFLDENHQGGLNHEKD